MLLRYKSLLLKLIDQLAATFCLINSRPDAICYSCLSVWPFRHSSPCNNRPASRSGRQNEEDDDDDDDDFLTSVFHRSFGLGLSSENDR